MIDLVVHYYLEVLLGMTVTGLGFLYRGYKASAKRSDAKADAIMIGMRALLRHHIMTSHNITMKQKCITVQELDHIEAMYCSYHALGGNGTVDNLMAKVRSLPTIDGDVVPVPPDRRKKATT